MKKKAKRYFLVDFENVNYNGLKGIDSLDENDTVIIFYSKASSSISELIKDLLSKTKSNVIFEKVDTLGKNALDFQLSSYVGYIVGLSDKISTYIVSKDFGYSNVQVFWYKKGKDVSLIPSIEKREIKEVTEEDIKEYLDKTKLQDRIKNEALEIIKQYLVGEDRYPNSISVSLWIQSNLEYKFNVTTANYIYKEIKPLIFGEEPDIQNS